MTYRSELIQVAAVALAALQNFDHHTTRLGSPEFGHAKDGLFQDLALEVYLERERQEAKWGERNETPNFWLTVMVEEVGEVARAILENDY